MLALAGGIGKQMMRICANDRGVLICVCSGFI